MASNSATTTNVLQALIEAAEAWVDEGLGMDKPIGGNDIGADFDLDGLLRMDSQTLAEVEGIKAKAGIASPDDFAPEVQPAAGPWW